MYVSSTKSIHISGYIAGLGASTSICDFRTSTLKMIKYKYRISSNILWYITSTFDMYLDTITKYQVHFRHFLYVINNAQQNKSTEFKSIVFVTLYHVYLVYFCSLTNLNM